MAFLKYTKILFILFLILFSSENIFAQFDCGPNTQNPNTNIGDFCDDDDDSTYADKIQDDCSCKGTKRRNPIRRFSYSPGTGHNKINDRLDSKKTTDANNTNQSFMNLSIVPNPFDDYIDISLSITDETDITFELLDINGRLIQGAKTRFISAQNNFRFKLKSDLGSGIYFLRIITNNGDVLTKKVVKN